MGLDMYLYLSKYESCGSWQPGFEQKAVGFYPADLDKLSSDLLKRDFLSKETYYQVGYWRKANAIHKWFVDVCASGIDECQKIYVPIERAKELRNLCQRVLDNHELAEELLPTEEGFFFGSQKYDEWYFEDLKYTKDLLEVVIKMANDFGYEIIYQASW